MRCDALASLVGQVADKRQTRGKRMPWPLISMKDSCRKLVQGEIWLEIGAWVIEISVPVDEG